MAARVALWTVTGLAFVLSVMGMFSVGILVLPVAVALLVLSVVVTARRPGSWPSVAGVGLALAAGLAWLGWVLATSGPSQLSCSGSSDGPTTCTSRGRVVDPDAVEWANAVPWFAAATVAAVVTGVLYVLAMARTRSRAPVVGR